MKVWRQSGWRCFPAGSNRTENKSSRRSERVIGRHNRRGFRPDEASGGVKERIGTVLSGIEIQEDDTAISIRDKTVNSAFARLGNELELTSQG